MAKVVYGPIVSDARNKIGGVVATKVRSGAMMRTKVSPIQPRTNTQRNVRAGLSAFAKAWGATLTAAQRLGWAALAALYPRKDKFGAAHNLSGIQMFMSINRNLATIGVAELDNAPSSLEATNPVTVTPTYTSPSPGPEALSVAVGTAPTTNEHATIYATAPLSPGRASFSSRYKFVYAGAAAGAGPYDVLSAYKAIYGAIPAGRQINFLVAYIDGTTGAKGIPNSASVATS